MLLIVAPWVIRIGYAGNGGVSRVHRRQPRVVHNRIALFYATAAATCFAILAISLYLISSSPTIWSARAHIGEVFGPYIIVLYIPLGILSFYVTTKDSRTVMGKLFTSVLVLLSVLSTLGMGERTLVLLPLLVVFLFGCRTSLKQLALRGAAMILLAAFLLPIFKAQFSGPTDSKSLATDMVNGDLSRAPVLIDSIQKSQLFGTKIMSYPGAGYFYSAFLYVPRSLVPQKGVSTATVFTATMTDSPIEGLGWGLGIGAFDELLLNFGWLLLLPGVVFYGFMLGAADRAAEGIPMLVIPASLSAIWLLGYNLPALLQTFGSLAMVGTVFHLLFAERSTQARSVPVIELVMSSPLHSAVRFTNGRRAISWITRSIP